MESKFTKLEWCCLQRNGIKLITPNEILGKSYLDGADSDFSEMDNATLKIKNILAYSACYNAFYSIAQKIGIKCEIDDCTLNLFSLIKGFKDEHIKFILTLKKTRDEIEESIQKPKEVDEDKISEFILVCKQVFSSLNREEIEEIREEIKVIMLGLKKNQIQKKNQKR